MKHLNILNSTLDGLIVAKKNGIITFCNHAANTMLGYSDEELIDLPVEVLLPEAFRHTHINQRSNYMTRPEKRVMNQKRRFTALKKDGSELPVTISLNPINIDDDMYICASIQDLTLIEAEATKLEQAQKLEALGAMVAGVAHNFNNVIAGISGQTYLLSKQELMSQKSQKRIQSINGLCEQASDVIKQLLIYARHQDSEFNNFELGETAHEVVEIARAYTTSKIDLKFTKLENDLIVSGMRSQIQQTLFNLINNAIHAIGDSAGSIDISTGNCLGLNCAIKQCTLNRDNARAFLCIKIFDTGKGIAESDIHRIFDPFYSTKEQAQGTGLGLSTSYGIIRKHGGEISASNMSNGGTLFQFFLPISETHTTDERQNIDSTTECDNKNIRN